MIKEFKGIHRFLSNFHPSPFTIDGVEFKTNEHFYQAMKTNDHYEFFNIVEAKGPGEAKQLGRQTNIRGDWDHIREEVMYMGLEAKFTQNPDLGKMLINTGEKVLQEGNNWNDKYWGVDLKTYKGKNRLGVLLMKLREIMVNDQTETLHSAT